ncbi:MAG: phosphatidylserine decarboxylase family protein [Deltaproteobacteria bacterium]|nr:phosphatidylserine decarboxylase family protein [Deltaproteobacteria bacterium]
MKIAKEGIWFIVLALGLAVGAYLVHWMVGVLFSLVSLFVINFFRDPERQAPIDSSLMVTGADGRILKIEQLTSSPYFNEPHQRISIFMSPFNVHVNRVPMDGTVEKIEYHPGKFFNASLDKASQHNERNAVWLKGLDGARVAFVQIAGFIARRIVCYAKVGDEYKKGERYGMIRFGSRMELYFPNDWKVLVGVGDKVYAGRTPLAKMGLS